MTTRLFKKAPRVESRKLIGPERPKKKEREHPVQQTAFRQDRIKGLS